MQFSIQFDRRFMGLAMQELYRRKGIESNRSEDGLQCHCHSAGRRRCIKFEVRHQCITATTASAMLYLYEGDIDIESTSIQNVNEGAGADVAKSRAH